MVHKQNKIPKLWICSEYFDPYGDKSAGFYMTEIATAAALNYDITVITAAQRNSGEEKNKYEIIRIKKLFKIEHNLLLRAVNHLALGLKYLFQLLLRVKRADSIFIVTNPSTLLIIASFVKFLKGCTLTVLVYDVFPENFTVLNGISKKSILYKAMVKIFNCGYGSAETLVSIGDDMTHILNNKLPDYRGSIIKITNWAETDDVTPKMKKDNKIISDHQLQNKMVFTFAGNIGRLQNIPFLIDTFNKDTPEEAHLLFVGGGALVDLVTKSTSDNISYAGSFPRNDQNDFLNACDIAIVSLAANMYGLGVPSKTYNILASGKPVLFVGEEGTEIYEMVKQNEIGWLVPAGDRECLIKTINRILSNPDEVLRKGLMARKLAESTYSQRTILNEYNAHFKSIFSHKETG